MRISDWSSDVCSSDLTPRHARLLNETLTQFEQHPGDWHDFLTWFYELPLFVDTQRFRVVHACWDNGLIEPLRGLFPDACIDEHFLQASAEPGSFACTVFDRLLRGTGMSRSAEHTSELQSRMRSLSA